MENGIVVNGIQNGVNGYHTPPSHEPTVEQLQAELPYSSPPMQFPLGAIVSRVMQTIYAELSEMADTMPTMTDTARKRTLADWVVKTKKQVVKLYAIVKWSRDAESLQKCMNISGFLSQQLLQFKEAIQELQVASDRLLDFRSRNHDLLTALDVLTTGTYTRLPTIIKKGIIPETPLADGEVSTTLSKLEDVIRFRLRMHEYVPPEMSHYRIADGRVYFTAPKLFEVSVSLAGSQKDDTWFFDQVSFLFCIGEDQSGMQDFPREPKASMRDMIRNCADQQLCHYAPLPEIAQTQGSEIPPRPKLPEGTVDAPLVRLYNFLQMMSLSYQLEILRFQASRMRGLGWAEYLKVETLNNRRTLKVSYWVRQPPSRPQPSNRFKHPLVGGTISISIVDIGGADQFHGRISSSRSPRSRVLAELQRKSKLGDMRPSDRVQSMKLEVAWEPTNGVLGMNFAKEDMSLREELEIDADDLDFEALLKRVIAKHTEVLLNAFRQMIQRVPRNPFSLPGQMALVREDQSHALHLHLRADEVIVVTIDVKTGRINLRNTGDLASVSRAPDYMMFSNQINDVPHNMVNILSHMRFKTVGDVIERKASYLGLRSFRDRNLSKEEMDKLPLARDKVFIQLENFPTHYLVILISDDGFHYVLMSMKPITPDLPNLIINDLAILDVKRIQQHFHDHSVITGQKRRRVDDGIGDSMDLSEIYKAFELDTQGLREIYSYSCARVAFMKVEAQLKQRGIPFRYVNPTVDLQLPEVAYVQSSLSRSVPGLSVNSMDILSGAPAAGAAMPNIRVIPLHWWSSMKAQVVMCVKLKHVQQPVGKRAGTSSIIRPSKRIIYDTVEAVVSFISDNVDTCVDEFLEEWARVSKIVVLAREVTEIAKTMPDVKLLSFDLQTVQFAYAPEYVVSITCFDQLLLTGGAFDVRFARCTPIGDRILRDSDHINPHDDAESFLCALLQPHNLAKSLRQFVLMLRETLPIVVLFESIRTSLQQDGSQDVDCFPKAAGWWRIMYGDSRYALDFRVLNQGRVSIVDASHKVFDHATNPSTKTSYEMFGLEPIPNFSGIVVDAVSELRGRKSLGRIAVLDVGVICPSSAVTAVGSAIHSRVVRRLKD